MKRKILIVEDDAVTRRILEVQLKASGFQTYLAFDGITALQVAQRERPDLVLLDLGLPGGDGFNVMHRIKQLTPLSSIPIIVFSARDPVQWKERSRQVRSLSSRSRPIMRNSWPRSEILLNDPCEREWVFSV